MHDHLAQATPIRLWCFPENCLSHKTVEGLSELMLAKSLEALLAQGKWYIAWAFIILK